jgi:uncharacterized protein (UPF0332 family)
VKEIANLVAKAQKFLMAEASLLTKGLRASSHKGVISLFGEHFVKPGVFRRELGRMLSEAYDRRLRGDHAIGFDIEEEEARNIRDEARGFLEEVRKYLEDAGALEP